MSFDLDLLRRMSPEQAKQYIEENYTFYAPTVDPGSGVAEAATGARYDMDPRWMGGQYAAAYTDPDSESGAGAYNPERVFLPSYDPDRDYILEVGDDGKVKYVGQQLSSGWYGQAGPLGFPVGAFLPVAAAVGGAYLPELLGGAGASTGTGAGGGLSALDAAAAYDAALTGVGSNVGSGLLTEGAMGATAGAGAAAGGAGAAGAGAAGAGGAGAAGAGAAGAGAGVLGTGLTAGQAAGLLGAAIGAATSGNRTATSTNQREPWGPAQDWIKDNIARGQALQRDYQANPFSSLQKNAYQNVFSGIDGFANGILPSVFGAVNSFRPYSRTGAPSTPTFNFQAPQRTNYGTLNWQDLIRMPQQPMTAGVQNNTPQGLL